MPLKPIAIVIALLALAAAVWLLVAAARPRRRWLGLLVRGTPALLLLALVASLVPYIFGVGAPHPFFNRAAPVAASTVIYYLAYSAPRNDQQPLTLIAVQGQTGKTLWRRIMPGDDATLADGGDTVYAVSQLSDASHILALNAATGAIRWQKALPNAMVDSAPVLARGVLFLGVARLDKQILALRPSDGSLLWSTSIGADAASISLSATADTLFVQFGIESHSPNDAFLQARRLTDGQLLWSESPMTGSLVLGADAVYDIPAYGPLVARDIHTGAKLWQYSGYDAFHAAIVSGHTLYVTAQRSGAADATNGNSSSLETVSALDAASGLLRWTKDIQIVLEPQAAIRANALAYSRMLVASRDTLYIWADGGIHALRASDGAVRWQSDPQNHWSLAAVVDHMLYVTKIQTLPPETLTLPGGERGQAYLYAINEADSSADWGVAVGPVIDIYAQRLS